MMPWIFGGALAAIIIIAMISDLRKSGLFANKKDWLIFGAFISSIVALGASSYWLSGFFDHDWRVAISVLFFASKVMVAATALNVWKRVQQAKLMREQGFMSRREYDDFIDSTLS
jgi:hypothetical protein